ncbi:hypothetical protein [Arthrobacter sp. YAF16]|uniref:hypothetical protein n=1 Tax=Arthrobacter sp. YAF16 TaxID=3233076 RepID=UPI003F925469
MGQDPCLVIRGAAAVEAAVAFDGGERLGLPEPEVAGRLDVVVGVEQDGGLAGCGGAACDDGRPARGSILLVAAQDPDVLEAAAADQFGDGVGAGIQRSRIEAGPGDARDRHERLQLLDGGVKGLGNGLTEGGGIDGADG